MDPESEDTHLKGTLFRTKTIMPKLVFVLDSALEEAMDEMMTKEMGELPRDQLLETLEQHLVPQVRNHLEPVVTHLLTLFATQFCRKEGN